jgi:hypothetical protein
MDAKSNPVVLCGQEYTSSYDGREWMLAFPLLLALAVNRERGGEDLSRAFRDKPRPYDGNEFIRNGQPAEVFSEH